VRVMGTRFATARGQTAGLFFFFCFLLMIGGREKTVEDRDPVHLERGQTAIARRNRKPRKHRKASRSVALSMTADGIVVRSGGERGWIGIGVGLDCDRKIAQSSEAQGWTCT